MEDQKMGMSPEQMEEKRSMVVQMCICKGCPSYEDCSAKGGQAELGFCFPSIGKSDCIAAEKGCICGGCPVTPKMGLKNIYFCTKGSEMDQEKSKQM